MRMARPRVWPASAACPTRSAVNSRPSASISLPTTLCFAASHCCARASAETGCSPVSTGMVTVPLGAGEGVFGALGLASRTSREIPEELMAVLLAIGREAGELVQRTRAEEEVRRLNLELEATVAERTAALAAANRALLAEIDERRRAEEELRGSEERYGRMFDLDPDALLVVDSETDRILDANEAAHAHVRLLARGTAPPQHRGPLGRARGAQRPVARRERRRSHARPARPPPAPRRRGVPRRDRGEHHQASPAAPSSRTPCATSPRANAAPTTCRPSPRSSSAC